MVQGDSVQTACSVKKKKGNSMIWLVRGDGGVSINS